MGDLIVARAAIISNALKGYSLPIWSARVERGRTVYSSVPTVNALGFLLDA